MFVQGSSVLRFNFLTFSCNISTLYSYYGLPHTSTIEMFNLQGGELSNERPSITISHNSALEQRKTVYFKCLRLKIDAFFEKRNQTTFFSIGELSLYRRGQIDFLLFTPSLGSQKTKRSMSIHSSLSVPWISIKIVFCPNLKRGKSRITLRIIQVMRRTSLSKPNENFHHIRQIYSHRVTIALVKTKEEHSEINILPSYLQNVC